MIYGAVQLMTTLKAVYNTVVASEWCGSTKVLGKHYPEKRNSNALKIVNTPVAVEVDAPQLPLPRDLAMLLHHFADITQWTQISIIPNKTFKRSTLRNLLNCILIIQCIQQAWPLSEAEESKELFDDLCS